MRIDPTRLAPITDPRPREASAPPPGEAEEQDSAVVTLSAGATSGSDGRPPQVTVRMAKIRELLAQDAYPIDLDQLAGHIVDDEAARRGSR